MRGACSPKRRGARPLCVPRPRPPHGQTGTSNPAPPPACALGEPSMRPAPPPRSLLSVKWSLPRIAAAPGGVRGALAIAPARGVLGGSGSLSQQAFLGSGSPSLGRSPPGPVGGPCTWPRARPPAGAPQTAPGGLPGGSWGPPLRLAPKCTRGPSAPAPSRLGCENGPPQVPSEVCSQGTDPAGH